MQNQQTNKQTVLLFAKSQRLTYIILKANFYVFNECPLRKILGIHAFLLSLVCFNPYTAE